MDSNSKFNMPDRELQLYQDGSLFPSACTRSGFFLLIPKVKRPCWIKAYRLTSPYVADFTFPFLNKRPCRNFHPSKIDMGILCLDKCLLSNKLWRTSKEGHTSRKKGESPVSLLFSPLSATTFLLGNQMRMFENSFSSRREAPPGQFPSRNGVESRCLPA